MKNLKEYFCKNVRLIDIDDKEWLGYVRTYTPAIDTDDDIEEIGLMTKNSDISFVGFQANEIKSIEILD